MGVSLYSDEVVAAGERVVAETIAAALDDDAKGAIVAAAPAGAGKSYAIGTAVIAARRAGRRVAVATPTNEQAFALVADIADRIDEAVTYLPRSGLSLPSEHERPNIATKGARNVIDDGIVVGTLNKLGDAFSRGDLKPVDLLMIDEAYQATSVHYYMVGDLAPKHLLVGDSGQLAPFSSAPEADRWRGLGEDPLLTAVEVLVRNHPRTRQNLLPITRRLDPRAVPVVRAFYPGHPFEAAVRPGVRAMRLSPRPKSRGLNATIDEAIDHGADAGWAHLELPQSAVVTADPITVDLIVKLLVRLFAREPKTVCEQHRRAKPLRPADVAVVVSHNDQKDRVRAAVRSAGLGDVTVETANKLQGLTFEVVVAWHPLAGLLDLDDFHLDPGRLCVMLTRHRHACFIVGRAGDRALVEGIPPASPAYVGWDASPALDGWYAHEGVFAGLEAHRVEVT